MATITVESYVLKSKKWQIDADRNSQLDYGFDWTKWLAIENDTIASVLFVLDPLLTQVNASHDALTATAWLTISPLAELDALLPVTCRITTNNTPPRIDDRTIYLRVVEK